MHCTDNVRGQVDKVVRMSSSAAPDELPPVIAFKELIELLGVSRTRTVHLLREPNFPRPIAVLGVGKIWSTEDVIAYCERTGRQVYPIGRARDAE